MKREHDNARHITIFFETAGMASMFDDKFVRDTSIDIVRVISRSIRVLPSEIGIEESDRRFVVYGDLDGTASCIPVEDEHDAATELLGVDADATGFYIELSPSGTRWAEHIRAANPEEEDV